MPAEAPQAREDQVRGILLVGDGFGPGHTRRPAREGGRALEVAEGRRREGPEGRRFENHDRVLGRGGLPLEPLGRVPRRGRVSAEERVEGPGPGGDGSRGRVGKGTELRPIEGEGDAARRRELIWFH